MFFLLELVYYRSKEFVNPPKFVEWKFPLPEKFEAAFVIILVLGKTFFFK